MTRPPVAIVGAGMAGLACATRLAARGVPAVLFDKGKGPSGRMAARRLATPQGEAVLDMGAQYFTVRDAGFAQQVASWRAAGLVAPWPQAGLDAWVGTPSMAAPLKAMAGDLQIAWETFVVGISRDGQGWRLHLKDRDVGPYSAVLVALPAEQATPLLALNDLSFMSASAASVSQPCWTGLFAFDAPLETTSPVFRDGRVLAWAARNTSKPGRAGPEAWVAQAQPDWSQAHLEDPAAEVSQALLEELWRVTGVTPRPALAAHAHRWRFARSAGVDLGLLWNPELGLGACGDWLIAPRVESAWLSGVQLAEQLADHVLTTAHGPNTGFGAGAAAAAARPRAAAKF